MRVRSVGVVLVAASAVFATAAPARAGGSSDPESQKRAVDQKVSALKDDLGESTREMKAAADALAKTESRLAEARTAVAQARSRLSEARSRDAAARAALDAAKRAEQKVEREVAVTVGRIEEREGVINGIARRAYQDGPLSEIAIVLTAETPRQFADRLTMVDRVTDDQRAAIDELDAERAELARKQGTLAAKRAESARLRAIAAGEVQRTRALEKRAVDGERRVSRLTAERRTGLQKAERARAADERRYREMQAESRRLERVLAERAAASRTSVSSSTTTSGSVLSRPVSGPITSPYGMRVHPVTGVYKLHDGVDFGASCGTPIRSAAGGKVISAGYAGAYGNQVVVEHGRINGTYLATSYSHLSGFAAHAGERVDRGEVIGYVGSTGYSTGCHLHFMVNANGSWVNPMNWL